MKESNMKKKSQTDWERIDSLKDEAINFSDTPELDETFFKEAVRWPGPKKQITLRIDPDVLDFFKTQGKGYQTNINMVLRKYMNIQKSHAT